MTAPLVCGQRKGTHPACAPTHRSTSQRGCRLSGGTWSQEVGCLWPAEPRRRPAHDLPHLPPSALCQSTDANKVTSLCLKPRWGSLSPGHAGSPELSQHSWWFHRPAPVSQLEHGALAPDTQGLLVKVRGSRPPSSLPICSPAAEAVRPAPLTPVLGPGVHSLFRTQSQDRA